MSRAEFVDASEVVIRPSTEAEFADAAMKRGKKVIQRTGGYWMETVPGFFEPIHWLARMRIEDVKRPCPICWGYRSTLHMDDARHANGYMPIHLLDDLDNYGEANLPSKRRNHLCKSRKAVQVVQVLDPRPLLDQGYDVLKSAVARTHHGSVPAFDQYCRNVRRQIEDSRSITLAGLVNGKIGGYVVLSAVDDVVYIDTVLLATEYLPTDIGTALAFETVQVSRRCSQIKNVVYGLHSREDPRLGVFKEGMGFKVRFWPVKYQIPQTMLWLIGWRWPDKLYRLTGRSDSGVCAPIDPSINIP